MNADGKVTSLLQLDEEDVEGLSAVPSQIQLAEPESNVSEAALNGDDSEEEPSAQEPAPDIIAAADLTTTESEI
jgi:hypothetical protein